MNNQVKTNNYYTVIKEEHDNSGMLYTLEIKWNMDAISKDFGKDGFIVQKLTVKNNTGASIGFEDDYYEAWKVKDGRVENNKNNEFDDRFNGYPSECCKTAISEVIYHPSKVEYFSVVYWVDIIDPEYTEVDNWPTGNPNAGDLRYCYVKDCRIRFNKKVTDRPVFVHEII